MKDATSYILSEIYRVLSGANLGVPIFPIARFPGSDSDLFVTINSAYFIPDRSKSGYSQEVYVKIGAVARVADNLLDEKRVSDLNSKILSALLPVNVQSQVINNSLEFDVYDVELNSGITFSEPYTNGRAIVRENEFAFKVNIK